jgi:hypothetical protein
MIACPVVPPDSDRCHGACVLPADRPPPPSLSATRTNPPPPLSNSSSLCGTPMPAPLPFSLPFHLCSSAKKPSSHPPSIPPCVTTSARKKQPRVAPPHQRVHLSSSGGRSTAVTIDFAPKRHHRPHLLGEHRHVRPHAPIERCLTSTTTPRAVGPHCHRRCSLESHHRLGRPCRRASHRLHVDGLVR